MFLFHIVIVFLSMENNAVMSIKGYTIFDYVYLLYDVTLNNLLSTPFLIDTQIEGVNDRMVPSPMVHVVCCTCIIRNSR